MGSVLYLTAQVAYSDSPLVDGFGDKKLSAEGYTRVQIRVDSKVRNIEHGETKPTGVFNYTFEVKGDVKIVPESYGQFMTFLDARRRCLRLGDEAEREGGQEGVLGEKKGGVMG